MDLWATTEALLKARKLALPDRNESVFALTDVLNSVADLLPNLEQVLPEVGVRAEILADTELLQYRSKPLAIEYESDCASSIDDQHGGYSLSVPRLTKILVDSLLLKLDQHEGPASSSQTGQLTEEWKDITTLVLWQQDSASFKELPHRKFGLDRFLDLKMQLRSKSTAFYFRGRPAFRIKFADEEACHRAFGTLRVQDALLPELRSLVGHQSILSRLVEDGTRTRRQRWCAVVIRYLPKGANKQELTNRLQKYGVGYKWIEELVDYSEYKCALVGVAGIEEGLNVIRHFKEMSRKQFKERPIKATFHPLSDLTWTGSDHSYYHLLAPRNKKNHS